MVVAYPRPESEQAWSAQALDRLRSVLIAAKSSDRFQVEWFGSLELRGHLVGERTVPIPGSVLRSWTARGWVTKEAHGDSRIERHLRWSYYRVTEAGHMALEGRA